MRKRPILSYHDAETEKITAHFDLKQYKKCEHYDNCPSRKFTTTPRVRNTD